MTSFTPFTLLDAVAAPLDLANVDTGLIMPARFLRKPRAEGFAKYLFRDLRFDDDGHERPDFVLNQTPYRGAPILVGDRSFGVGSSREPATWGLADYGIRAVVAADFGEILYLNAFKSGILPVQLPLDVCAGLRAQLHAKPGAHICIDLPAQTLTAPDGTVHPFPIDGFRKRCLLEGLDDVGLTLDQSDAIDAFERTYAARFPWIVER